MFALMAFSVVSIASVLFPEAMEPVLAFIGLSSGESIFLAATTVLVGPDTYQNATSSKPRTAQQPGHLKDDISSIVTKIRPDLAPLDTMLRKLNSSEKAENLEVFFEEVTFRGSQSTLTAAVTAPVDPAEPTEAEIYKTISVANPELFVEGEMIYVKSVLVSGVPLQLRVDEKLAHGNLVVSALNQNYVPAIADATVIYRTSPSAGELKAQVQPVTHYPDMRSNYCQRFMAQIEQSVIRGNVPSNSGFNFSDQQYIKMYEMRTAMEKQNIWGVKSKRFSKKDNDWVYTAEGIYWQLATNLDYTGASGIDNNRWIDWTKTLFSDNAGSTDRVLFAGSGLTAEILKIPLVQKQLDAQSVEVVPGLKIKVIETNFGNIMIYHHKGFDTMGHTDDGMVVDMTNIKKRPFQPMKVTELELRKSGQRNVRARLIDEIFCLETRYLGTHARIRKTG